MMNQERIDRANDKIKELAILVKEINDLTGRKSKVEDLIENGKKVGKIVRYIKE